MSADASATDPPLHPALEALRPLLGTFEGGGHGDYPTIDAFDYHERVTIGHRGTPVLGYEQRTWHPLRGTAMHGESGYLRPAGEGRVEVMLAHVFGVTELLEGDYELGADGGVTLRLSSTTIGLAATAKDVRSVRRELRFDRVGLGYDVWMAHADVPETHHLAAVLHRTGPTGASS